MNWGHDDKQSRYKAGRKLKEIRKDQIDGVCQCGYITLKPTNDFELHNGGLTVKRSDVTITDNGKLVIRLRGVLTYSHCNACINNWK